MSLIDDATETFVLMNETRTLDDYGGYNTKWTDGPEISGAIVFNKSIESLTAQAQGVTSTYMLTTKKSTVLKYHDVLKRSRDSKIFRVTSDGDDSFTPSSSSLDMRQVICEEWKLT